MSYDDKNFTARGFRVRHTYGGRTKSLPCTRCGVRRRKTTSGWEWRRPAQGARWTTSNPPCAKRDESPQKRCAGCKRVLLLYHAPGNTGWEDRLAWFVQELVRQTGTRGP